MRAGKHVLCEKLMAWNISQCKKMIQVARETGRILSVGHQRHYSMLYAHAHEILEAGVLGEVRHIRALWHRNNSWPFREEAGSAYKLAEGYAQPHYRDGWYPPIYDIDEKELKGKTESHGYKSVEELVRWRLYNETGGGLMAELGSHQMDACSIFLGKVHPLSVTGVGGKYFYGPGRNDRESDDSIFITYEFPGQLTHWAATRAATKMILLLSPIPHSTPTRSSLMASASWVVGVAWWLSRSSRFTCILKRIRTRNRAMLDPLKYR